MAATATRVVSDQGAARMLVDPVKRQILRHLAEEELTQKMLAQRIGIADPSVYYHLKGLSAAGLVRVVRREPERHGIVQKFYGAGALYFIVDYAKVPLDLKRDLLAVNLERLRGVFAILKALRGTAVSLSTVEMEALADRVARSLVEVAREHEGRPFDGGRESLIIALYGEAMARVMENDPGGVSALSSRLATLGLGSSS
ncbi:MAG: helix-turn-helix transcriptional regulator [Nitrososphaerota archaeon]|nr:helix-turn-helix transcriptional regulator [Nitrososphaerota archaeon]MDG7022700.1 helix-turn-helix transcriptional regulator [Nitrososphaerota archaeon]